MKRFVTAVVYILLLGGVVFSAQAESKRHYENRFRAMLDYAVSVNEYSRRHLDDRNLCAYVHKMADLNASQAEQMTPPPKYAMLHPHFLLVLENVERALHFASEGRLDRYRHHQKIVRKELHMLENLAQQANLSLYMHRN